MKKSLYLLSFGLLFFACGPREEPQDTNIRLSDQEITIDYDDTYQLNAEFRREGYSPDGFVWDSDDEGIASVEDGMVTGNRAGVTQISVSTNDQLFTSSAMVTVVPTNMMLMEPLLDFRQTRQFVRDNETREFSMELDEFLVFEGENEKVEFVAYYFGNIGYQESIISITPTQQNLDEAVEFLVQRYEPLEATANAILFATDDYYVIIEVTEDSQIFILYLEIQGTNINGKLDLHISDKYDEIMKSGHSGGELEIKLK
ncbi:Ig-like domain-containing protein [Litoribacter ruber]|uniref:Ig-like domain-containing protein n=1 Tax=Litoribacter ruber TaxID=702568 RepID=UPI001BD95C88|nr:Ig-like domain-containing protein [Litoribacter ruber]MBT0811590.1 Ig-like domain-containing protein [Litoribacter ruber]